MGHRRQGREYALQLLFQVEMTRDPIAEVELRFWADQSPNQSARDFASELAGGTLKNLADIDQRIAGATEHWRLERMAVVDRNVLRIAVFELAYLQETPTAVVMDEAIEVVRKFGAPESAPFINGVLDAIRRDVERARART
jgi:N utilization substance protein B